MQATAAVLLAALTFATPLAWADGPDPTERAMTPGWYRLTVQDKTSERCFVGAGQLPSNDELGAECKRVKLVEQGEQFEVVQSCQVDETQLTMRMTGIARPGYFKAKTEYVGVPEELREFFKGSMTTEAQRLRDCTAAETAQANAELARMKKGLKTLKELEERRRD